MGANVLLNFGFLFFGVTDYVTKMNTLHYGANFEGLESLPSSFEHHDEFFNFNKNPCDNADIIPLLYVDETSYEGGLMGEKHPVVWHQYKGEKRAPIFYCALGHFTHFYNSTGPKQVQTILKSALRFVSTSNETK